MNMTETGKVYSVAHYSKLHSKVSNVYTYLIVVRIKSIFLNYKLLYLNNY